MISNVAVSVCILNYRADELYTKCYKSVMQSSFIDYEIIGVHNSQTNLPGKIHNHRNVGPAVGLNQGVKMAQGKYVLLLAADCEIDMYFLARAYNYMEHNPKVGILGGKVYDGEEGTDRLDSVGEFLTGCGFLLHRHLGNDRDVGQFERITKVFSVKGCGMVIRKSIFDTIDLHDEDLFMMLEDTDLCARANLAGWEVHYNPELEIYHLGGQSIAKAKNKNYIIYHLGCRNYIVMLLKILSIPRLLVVLPIHLMLWCLLGIYNRHLFIYLDAFLWVPWNLAHILHRRRAIKRVQKLSIVRSPFYMFWRRLL